MQGVVSLLDDTHRARLEQLQTGLEQALGEPGLCRTPIAHFSYHVAEEYDPDMLAATLLSFAASNMRFRVRTSGFGVFTRVNPVLYIPLVRSPLLSALHNVLWRQLSRASSGASIHYHPDWWLPHITLASGEGLAERLPDLVGLLSGLDLSWDIEISNIALLYGQGEALEIRFRQELIPERRTKD